MVVVGAVGDQEAGWLYLKLLIQMQRMQQELPPPPPPPPNQVLLSGNVSIMGVYSSTVTINMGTRHKTENIQNNRSGDTSHTLNYTHNWV